MNFNLIETKASKGGHILLRSNIINSISAALNCFHITVKSMRQRDIIHNAMGSNSFCRNNIFYKDFFS